MQGSKRLGVKTPRGLKTPKRQNNTDPEVFVYKPAKTMDSDVLSFLLEPYVKFLSKFEGYCL